MPPHRDNHQVRCPAMHVSKELSERHIVLKVENVAKCLHLGGMVINHQQRSGERQHDKQVERDAAHPPRIVVRDSVTVDLGGMKVQEDVREHSQSTTAWFVIVFDAKNGLVELGLFRILQRLHVLDAL